MKLFEFYDANQADEDYQDQKDDNSVPELGDLRKTKLTLEQINSIRKEQEMGWNIIQAHC